MSNAYYWIGFSLVWLSIFVGLIVGIGYLFQFLIKQIEKRLHELRVFKAVIYYFRNKSEIDEMVKKHRESE
jgi:hypothetical protein